MTKTQSSSAKALHVGVVREGRFIEDRRFEGEIDITIGTAEKNTFALPLSTLPAVLPLFMHKQGKLLLQFDEKARGKLTYRGKELELSDCRKQGLAVPHAGFFELPLGDDARGRITIGEVSFVFNFAPPPPVAPKPVLPKEARGTIWNVTDHTFFSILMVSLVLHACAIAAISRRDLPPDDAAMEDIPGSLRRAAHPGEAARGRAAQGRGEARRGAGGEEGGQERGEEGRASQGLRRAQGRRAEGGGAEGPGQDPGLGSGRGRAGRSPTCWRRAAASRMTSARRWRARAGVAIATEAGGGARRGEGAAQAESIGGIATSGGGNVKLREKQDVAVHGSVSSDGDAEVESDSVDKDALARFIKMRIGGIRNCYESQLKRSPNLRGKLVVRFTIGTLGQVIEVSIDSDTIGSDDVASCVMRQVKLWRFPFKPPSDTPVSFPFLFSPAG